MHLLKETNETGIHADLSDYRPTASQPKISALGASGPPGRQGRARPPGSECPTARRSSNRDWACKAQVECPPSFPPARRFPLCPCHGPSSPAVCFGVPRLVPLRRLRTEALLAVFSPLHPTAAAFALAAEWHRRRRAAGARYRLLTRSLAHRLAARKPSLSCRALPQLQSKNGRVRGIGGGVCDIPASRARTRKE